MTRSIEVFLLCAALLLLVRCLRKCFAKSSLDNVPGPSSDSIWLGNIFLIFSRHGGAFQRNIVRQYPSVTNIKGLFGAPVLYVHDARALHAILVKEQNTYAETFAYRKLCSALFGAGMLSSIGDQHRKQRKLLNPVFSVRHIRSMAPMFYEVARSLQSGLASEVRQGPQEVNIALWMSRTSLEMIGRGALGYHFESLSGKGNAFGEAITGLIPTLTGLGVLRLALPYAASFGSQTFRRRLAKLVPHVQVQRLRRILETLHEKSTEIYHTRKVAVLKGGDLGDNKDILSILIKENMATSEEDRLPEAELIAQMSEFTFAGADTTSNSLCSILHLLAQHPEAQARLRKEVVEASRGKDLSYDELIQLPYLDAVCRESLRLHPPATPITRECEKDAILPLSEPIRGLDGTLMHEIPVPKGTLIIIGILGSNCNRNVWGEDAFQWKPERWLSPLPASVTEAHIPGVYTNLMTFAGGGRACIGFKFSELEMKLVLAVLLSTFTFELNDKPIVWNISHVNYPTVGWASNKIELPLKVGLVQRGTV